MDFNNKYLPQGTFIWLPEDWVEEDWVEEDWVAEDSVSKVKIIKVWTLAVTFYSKGIQ